MKVPDYIVSSLDLIDNKEKRQVLRALAFLDANESDLGTVYRRSVKLIPKGLYLTKGSRRYRIVFEIVDGEINVTDVIHHDKIKLVIRRAGRAS